MARQAGLFDTDERLRALSAAGDPLERLAAVVDFELFRPELETALARGERSRGGRPPFDAVLMFRILVLQALDTLSDEQTEYQLRDRLSFTRFVGLALYDAVPDAIAQRSVSEGAASRAGRGARKQRSKASGSTSVSTRRNVSCDGMPPGRSRKPRSQPSLHRP